jgi:hypothetical protein
VRFEVDASLIAQAKTILPGALLAIVAAAITITDAYATSGRGEAATRLAGVTPCLAISQEEGTKGMPDDRTFRVDSRTCHPAGKG